jgi:starch phosphorylase
MSNRIAYFSAEFGIDESLPIYSGGLGVLAGDHIKAADDLELPLTGIGIFYSKGYFQQRIREDGAQEHLYPTLDTDQLPVEQVFDPKTGEPLRLRVPIANRSVLLTAWSLKVGGIHVYLLSSDAEQNTPEDRALTNTLYPSDTDTRMSQELILGIGGVRLLRALGVHPNVWHMNEGHSAFLALERIRELSAEGVPFEIALEAVRANTLFTTHTPVPAGHDVFGLEQIDRFLGDFYWQLGADREQIIELGRIGDTFNMTRLAWNTSSKVNGVSRLHEEVTKELIHQWTPHIPKKDIPVHSVTNGIHIGTWMSEDMRVLLSQHLDAGWEGKNADQNVWKPIWDIPDHQLWEVHQKTKLKMIRRLGLSAYPPLKNTLTIGFARRFATYKRANLIFRDLDRLDKIVNDPMQPIRFIFAGKAHPSDRQGQDLIRRIAEVSKMKRFKDRIFLVENYDMGVAKSLVQGVDVWLNTPVKPMEASGTSGQKAAVNGVLNCSILDGWWNEGYNGRNGWAIIGEGSGEEADSTALYHLLEKEIVPLYYQRDDRSIPAEWVKMMKESMGTLAPQFNTQRMVADYWNKLYLPLMKRGNTFTENDLEISKKVSAFKRFIRDHWHQVQIQQIDSHRSKVTKIGISQVFFSVKVNLGPIWHKDVRVEMVGSDLRGGIWKSELSLARSLGEGVYLFEGALWDTHDVYPKANANARVTPISSNFGSDFEMELSTWG